MRVFLVNENNELAMKLIKKLQGAKHGQIIPVSPEELKFYKSGNLIALDLPEDVAGTKLSIQSPLGSGSGVPIPNPPKPPIGVVGGNAKVIASGATTVASPKPQDTAPKSPASE